MRPTLSGRVLITGGTGFLARAFYTRAEAEGWDATFTCLSRDDSKQAMIAKRWPNVRTIRADVAGGVETLATAFAGHDIVIHAAAAKYVDRSEFAAFDTTRVNVEGSRDVAHAARIAGVSQVVGISTDKACEPANVYGMSKAIMERLFLEADGWPSRHGWGDGVAFSVVRYGNVIGSTGSIVPIFQRQIEELGQVTITDPKMTRFWMSTDEAIDLVCHSLEHRGVITLPKPRSLKLGDVVDSLIRGTGASIERIGIRPGEKMHETLISEQEAARTLIQYDDSPYCYVLPPGAVRSTGAELAGAITSKVPLGGWLTGDEFLEIVRASEAI
jgi:FlaA1/EpsC-like NDP-sugar epimerase